MPRAAQSVSSNTALARIKEAKSGRYSAFERRRRCLRVMPLSVRPVIWRRSRQVAADGRKTKMPGRIEATTLPPGTGVRN